MARLGDLRSYVVVLKTKSDDIDYPGFRTIRSTKEISVNSRKYILRPKYEEQRAQGAALFEMAWKEGGWCIQIDELWYVCQELKLDRPVNRLLTQGRSLGISVVAGIQRPVQVTRFALTECIHLFVFRIEGRDIKEVRDATTPRMEQPIEQLQRYQFVYFNRLTGEVKTAKAQQLGSL